MKKNLLLISILIFVLVTSIGCKKITLGSESVEQITTNENTSAPTVTPSDDDSEATEQVEATKDTEDDKSDATSDKKEDTSNKNTSANTKTNTQQANNSNTVVFKDFLETQEYEVKTAGTYSFWCKPSDGKSTWDIYVLDEKFEDALRYLTSAYQPVLTATSKAQTYKLQKGQYVYCICSENSLTFDGDEGSFSCPLAIKLN